MLAYRVHCATKVFAARTLYNKSFNAATLTLTRRLLGLAVANSVAVAVALIVSYLIIVTDNNRMMISLRNMFKKIIN